MVFDNRPGGLQDVVVQGARLNHLNLFGAGYASQAEHMMDSLLSELD